MAKRRMAGPSVHIDQPNGLKAVLIDYGATLVSLETPDREGNFANITLGCPNLQSYEENSPYFGCVAGRCANRIALGKFTLDGTEYTLATNNPPNHLHGGEKGFDKKAWTSEHGAWWNCVPERRYGGGVSRQPLSTVKGARNDNSLSFEYEATTDKPGW